MVVFRPFRGWRYNPDVVGDLASVVSPPYDLITAELQESLRRLSPYNVVHLEAGEGLDWNAPAEDQYRQTAMVFDLWQSQRVLLRDQEPCFYLLQHAYNFQGRRRTRLGLTGCVGLEDYQGRQVFPHEYTEEPAVLDRVSLMQHCNTNFSPIMALYRDSARSLDPVIREVKAGSPVIRVRADSDQDLTLWQISDKGLQEKVLGFFTSTPVFLADGHHRYEAALRFREMKSSGSGQSAGAAAAHNFVMMTLIEFDDPGLLVLPYHRVVGGLPPATLARLQERLRQIFDFQPVTLPADRPAEGMLELVGGHGDEGKVVGLVGPAGESPHLISLRAELDWRGWGPLAVSEAWILEEQVLKPVLGESIPEHVGYVHDHQEALGQVASGECQMAFLLKPFPMGQFEEIVRQGQRLPPKSTFFYPKLPTGLVINQLDGTL